MKLLPSSLLLSLVLGFATVGCGGDDDDDKGPSAPRVFDSGVQEKDANGESKQLKDLTPEDKMAACKALETYVASQFTPADVKALTCAYAGLFLAAFSDPKTDEEARAACTMGQSQCLSAPQMPDQGTTEPIVTQTPPCVFDEQPTCTATVAEVEACYTEAITQSTNAIRSLSCSTLTLADLATEEPDPSEVEEELPASCKVVEMKCPGFLEDDGEVEEL